jgi:hypothetical protein
VVVTSKLSSSQLVCRCSALLAKLKGLDGLVSMNFVPGHVLCYRGHYPKGIFIVQNGGVIAREERAGQRDVSISANGRGMLVPRIDLLNQPMPCTIEIASKGDMFYVPRSAILALPELNPLAQGSSQAEPHRCS